MKSLFVDDERGELYTPEADKLNSEVMAFATKVFEKYADFPTREVESIIFDAFYSAGIFARCYRRFDKNETPEG